MVKKLSGVDVVAELSIDRIVGIFWVLDVGCITDIGPVVVVPVG